MKKWIIIIAVAAVLCTAGVGGYLLLSKGSGPGGDFTDPGLDLVAQSESIEVQHGEIHSQVVLSATVRAEPGVAVKSKKSGTVTRIWLSDGQPVEEGAPVVSIAVPNEAVGTGDDTAAPATIESIVRAPATGTLSGLGDLAVGDPVDAGPIAKIAKDEFHAVAAIAPNEVYKFYDEPSEILLKIDKGPAPEPCEFISLGTGSSSGQSSSDDAFDVGEHLSGSDGDGSSLELTCRIPAGLKVFPGVRGKLSVVTGESKNTLIVPVTAVRGSVEKGEVIVIGSDGSEEVRKVELGVSDGSNVEIVKGLSIGDKIMNPVPLSEEFDVPSEALTEDEMFDDYGFEG